MSHAFVLIFSPKSLTQVEIECKQDTNEVKLVIITY